MRTTTTGRGSARSVVVCRETETEARAFWHHYVHELGDLEAADNLMRGIGLESDVLGKENYERERDRFISGWGGVQMIGTPEQVAERLALLSEAGCDGTLLLFPIWEEGLSQFRDEVLPLLERAGLRQPYVGQASAEGATAGARS